MIESWVIAGQTIGSYTGWKGGDGVMGAESRRRSIAAAYPTECHTTPSTLARKGVTTDDEFGVKILTASDPPLNPIIDPCHAPDP
jgi:hypothetical protein